MSAFFARITDRYLAYDSGAEMRERYAGMSYEQMSREAASLIAQANKSGDWFSILDTLVFLRERMKLVLRSEKF